MTDHIHTTMAAAIKPYLLGDDSPASDTVRQQFAESVADVALTALKAARIAVVELPEVSQEDMYHQYWISIAPNASIKYEYDGSWDSSEHVREFATALLAAADIAEASQ